MYWTYQYHLYIYISIGFCCHLLISLSSGAEQPAGNNLPVDGAEWVELLVREVLTAANVEDAKARLSQALEALEKSICANASAETAKSFQKVC